MWQFDQTVNQVMQKCQVAFELFRICVTQIWKNLITDSFPTQLLMPGIGFDTGEETFELVMLEVTNSKWKMKLAFYVWCDSFELSSSDVYIIMKNETIIFSRVCACMCVWERVSVFICVLEI